MCIVSELTGKVGIPDDAAVLLWGSIAEGLGNTKSDIDLIVVVDGEHAVPKERSMHQVMGRRVELFYRTHQELLAQAHSMETRAVAGATQIDYQDLHEFQMLANPLILRDRPFLNDVLLQFRSEHAAALGERYYTDHALVSIRRAMADAVLGRTHHALSRARFALLAAAKAYVIARGETYLPAKFLHHQLDRLEGHPFSTAELRGLLDPGEPPADAGDYVSRVRSLISEIPGFRALRSLQDRPEAVSFDSISAWNLEAKTYLVKADRIFLLSGEARSLWSEITSRGRLPIEESRSEDQRTCLREFFEHGLIRFEFDNGMSWSAGRRVLPDRWKAPFVGGLGVLTYPDDPVWQVRELPMGARSFVEAVLEVYDSQLAIDYLWEDFDGALAEGDLYGLRMALLRQTSNVCRLLANAFGISPVPPEDEILAELVTHPDLQASIGNRLQKLDFINVTSVDDAKRHRSEIEAIIERLPSSLQGAWMRRSNESDALWRTITARAFPWMLLAHRLGATVPVRESARWIKTLLDGPLETRDVGDK